MRPTDCTSVRPGGARPLGPATWAVLLLLLAWSKSASAYPFMIEHGYTACAQCHVDPSGGGVLTEYGRGAAEILLRTPWKPRAPDWQPGRIKDFAFGAVLPKWLGLQADGRLLIVPEPGKVRWVLMQSDLRAAIQASKFVVYASAGYVSQGGTAAWLTRNTGAGGNLVSREYWVGWNAAKGLLVRGGRMALPFGIRSEEHTLFARSATQTDSNAQQQVGVDAVYGSRRFRAEGMAILGNFQVAPDTFRERGYSFAGSWSVTKSAEVGVSSLLAHAKLDTDTLTEQIRQAHGVFARVAPAERVGLLAEADLLVDGTLGPKFGTTGYLQVDVEAVSGLHLRGTGEWCDDDLRDTDTATLRGSGTALWFFAPHADLRVDALYGTRACTPSLSPSFMGLVQAHFFL